MRRRLPHSDCNASYGGSTTANVATITTPSKMHIANMVRVTPYLFSMFELTFSGSVVRVSPNELSFASVESWKAIYGHRSTGTPTPIKSEFYDIYGAGFESLCIGSERNPKKHGQMRKMISAAFSTKSLLEQENIVAKEIDEFVERLGKDGANPNGINMTKWYEMVTFDTLGEMAFGESFHSVKQGVSHVHSQDLLAMWLNNQLQESLIVGQN